MFIDDKNKHFSSDPNFSWQRWSGRPRHGAQWRERTLRAWRGCRCHCPKTRYQPESRHQPSHRPEGHQSHPEIHKIHFEFSLHPIIKAQDYRIYLKHVQSNVTSSLGRILRGQSLRESHHAGGGTRGTSADHEVGDLAAPETLALRVGQQRECSLLQQGGGVGGWREGNHNLMCKIYSWSQQLHLSETDDLNAKHFVFRLQKGTGHSCKSDPFIRDNKWIIK